VRETERRKRSGEGGTKRKNSTQGRSELRLRKDSKLAQNQYMLSLSRKERPGEGPPAPTNRHHRGLTGQEISFKRPLDGLLRLGGNGGGGGIGEGPRSASGCPEEISIKTSRHLRG